MDDRKRLGWEGKVNGSQNGITGSKDVARIRGLNIIRILCLSLSSSLFLWSLAALRAHFYSFPLDRKKKILTNSKCTDPKADLSMNALGKRRRRIGVNKKRG